MSRIFLSYRRQESAGYAGRLYERLSGRFGRWQVFRDLDTIQAGENWPARLDKELRGCEVVVALIGPTFASACGADGRPRLDQSEDVVRLELEAALRRGVVLIPTLVQGAPMPARSDLPDSLAALADRQAISLGDGSWESDLERLVDAVEQTLREAAETNLPVPPTPFLGRERELGEVTALVRQSGVRLVTLTGTGGTGKTRLAVEAASRVLADFEAVFWVDLTPLRDPSLVLETVAQTLGARQELTQHIGERRVLLVLDNFEQLVAAAPALAELLYACPEAKGLVTSRELLHVAVEQVYALPSLVEEEAVFFFCARGRAIQPGFEGNGAVPEICRRLDCLPLALELAAARLPLLGTEQLLERLEQRLPLLTRGARDAPERQRTLEATIAWSYDLLTDEEQRLFRGLAVFAGGCTLEAAEAVLGAELDTVQSLVEKSLLRHSSDRFWMLQTIREYATERLEEAGESNELRRCHADWFRAVLVAFGDRLRREDPAATACAEAEHDNARAVLDWSLRSGELGFALDLVYALCRFWISCGYLREGDEWGRKVCAASVRLPAAERVWALAGAGELARFSGDFDRAVACHEEALQVMRELGEELQVAGILGCLADIAKLRGDIDRARALSGEASALARRLGDARGIALGLYGSGLIEFAARDFVTARARFAEVISSGDFDDKASLSEAAEEMIAQCARRLGDSADARTHLRRALGIWADLNEPHGAPELLQEIGALLLAEGQPARAASLLGASEAALREVGGVRWDAPDYEQNVQATRAALGEQAFDAAWATGAGMSLEEAMADALESLS